MAIISSLDVDGHHQCQRKRVRRAGTHHEGQRQAAECELFDVGLGDGAAGVDLVAGIILQEGETVHLLVISLSRHRR